MKWTSSSSMYRSSYDNKYSSMSTFSANVLFFQLPVLSFLTSAGLLSDISEKSLSLLLIILSLSFKSSQVISSSSSTSSTVSSDSSDSISSASFSSSITFSSSFKSSSVSPVFASSSADPHADKINTELKIINKYFFKLPT